MFPGPFDNASVNARIALDNPIVYPGNTLQGMIRVECRAPTRVRALRLKIMGVEKAEYTPSSFDSDHSIMENDRSRSTVSETPLPHYAQSVLMDITIGIAGVGSNAGEFIIPMGVYSYPFAYTLPNHIPGSFRYEERTTKCEITYTASAILDIPWSRDVVDEALFQVLSCCPLSQWESSKPCLMQQQIEVVKCCCINKGYVNVDSLLQRSILVMGRDNAYLSLDADNQSECDVHAVELQLFMKCTIRDGKRPHEEESLVMKHTERIHIGQNQRQHVDLGFTIPKGILPTVTGKIISVESTLKLTFKVKGASDPVLNFPIFLVHEVDTSNTIPPIIFGQAKSSMRANLPEMSQQAAPQHFAYAPVAGVSGFNPFPSNIPPPQGAIYDMNRYPGLPIPNGTMAQLQPHHYAMRFEYNPVSPTQIGGIIGAALGSAVGHSLQ